MTRPLRSNTAGTNGSNAAGFLTGNPSRCENPPAGGSTLEEVLAAMETLRRENQEVRRRAEEAERLYQRNHTETSNNPTLQEILATVETLRRENEEARQRAEEAERLRQHHIETLNNDPAIREIKITVEALRRENEEARRRVEESERLRQEDHERMRHLNEDHQRRAEAAQAALQAQIAELRRGNTEGGGPEPSRGGVEPPRAFQPFSEAIEREVVPPYLAIPRITPFDGTQDPDEHLMIYRAHMLINGGSDAVFCKLFVGTLTGTALKWFSQLVDRSVTGYDVLSRLFVAQFAANKRKSMTIADLLDVRQYREESLKEYLDRFNQVAIKVANPDEQMFVIAFSKGLRSGPFSESLVQRTAENMTEVRARAACHIEAEESETWKREAEKRENTHTLTTTNS
ncbi:uncharacterized protein LOC109814597 [Cajanus cajan]|uniref:uncharacterized protein LOC109814597 n=1 Tax=Cajanus cajan TaxID=3821 RepID=UPI00098DC6C3|nr:uncharacterized protein LOC109814597 [Cajanus cajan]